MTIVIPCLEGEGEREAFRDIVNSLRDEVRGLRQSARLRAVIEQAKGMLIEREGISADQAFQTLKRLSQEHNVRLVEVAATLIGIAVPADGQPEDLERAIGRELPDSVAASQAWRSLRNRPEVRAGVLGAVLDAVASGSHRGGEAAELLFDLLAPFAVDAVTIYRHLADGSLRLVGQVGVAPDLASSWVQIPPATSIPDIAVLQAGRPRFWASAEQRSTDYPASEGIAASFEASAALPLFDSDRVVGVVGLMWNSPGAVAEDRRAGIMKLVQRVGPMLLRDVTPMDPELLWLELVLRLHSDPFVLMEVLPDGIGRIEDFVLLDVSARVPGQQDLLGRRFLEAWPSALGEGVVQALTGLSATGGSWTHSVGQPSDSPWGTPGTMLSAARLGRRVVLVWMPPRTT